MKGFCCNGLFGIHFRSIKIVFTFTIFLLNLAVSKFDCTYLFLNKSIYSFCIFSFRKSLLRGPHTHETVNLKATFVEPLSALFRYVRPETKYFSGPLDFWTNCLYWVLLWSFQNAIFFVLNKTRTWTKPGKVCYYFFCFANKNASKIRLVFVENMFPVEIDFDLRMRRTDGHY